MRRCGAVIGVCLLASCAEDDMSESRLPSSGDTELWGILELSLGNATRATSTVISKEEADNFWVTVYKGEDICRDKTRLRNLDTRLTAGYGYVVKAENCTEAEAETTHEGWGQRRYAGISSPFGIKPGETTKVGVNCSVTNAGVEVVFDETIPAHFTTSYRVTIAEGERTIVFDEMTGGKREGDIVTSGKVAYYNIDDSGTRILTCKIEAYGEGTQLVKNKTICVTQSKINRLTLTFVPGTLDLDLMLNQEDIFINYQVEITEDNLIQDDGSADINSSHEGFEEGEGDVDISDYGQL